MAKSNNKVVADSNHFFSTFRASYREEAEQAGDEINVRLDYKHRLYDLDTGAYAVAWIMDFSGSMFSQVKLGVDGAADVEKLDEEKEREPPKPLRRIDVAKMRFEEWINKVKPRTKKKSIYLAVIKFSDEATCVTKGFEKLTASNIPQIIKKVNALEIDGGTQMSKGFDCLWEQETEFLKTLEKKKDDDSSLRPVRLEVHISSDGAVFDAEEVIKSVKHAQYRMENAYSESDSAEREQALFLFFELNAYSIDGDAEAVSFFKDLTKATSGTLITTWEHEKVIGSVHEEETGVNFKNTLTLKVPAESRGKVKIDLRKMKKNMPSPWTPVPDKCTAESCTYILTKAEAGRERFVTISMLLNTTLDEPDEFFPFLDVCLETQFGHSRRKGGFKTSLNLPLTIRRVENADTSDPKDVEASCKVNDAKDLFSELSDALSNDESENVRIDVQESLELFLQSISESLMMFGEIRITVHLATYAQKELDKPADQVSNSKGSRLLFVMYTSVDTLELPYELAQKIRKLDGGKNDEKAGYVPFDVGRDERRSKTDLQNVRKGKHVGVVLVELVRRSVRRSSMSTPTLSGLEDPALQQIARRSMRRRVYLAIMGKARKHEMADENN